MPAPFNTPFRAWPVPGTVVSVPIFVIYRHKGIVSDRWYNGKPMIISNSGRFGGVAEEPWDVFAQGRPVTAERFSGTTPLHQVVSRARSLIGTQYNLYDWNCEHLVTYAYGLKPHSQQVTTTLAIATFCGVLATIGR